MEKVLEILKSKRELVIASLKEEFVFKAVELKILMNDFVGFLKNENYNESDLISNADIKRAVNCFYNEMGDSYSSDSVACQNFTNEEIKKSKNNL